MTKRHTINFTFYQKQHTTKINISIDLITDMVHTPTFIHVYHSKQEIITSHSYRFYERSLHMKNLHKGVS